MRAEEEERQRARAAIEVLHHRCVNVTFVRYQESGRKRERAAAEEAEKARQRAIEEEKEKARQRAAVEVRQIASPSQIL